METLNYRNYKDIVTMEASQEIARAVSNGAISSHHVWP